MVPMKTIPIEGLAEVPWQRGDWSGEFISLDDAIITDVTIDDVLKIIAYGSTGSSHDSWSGNVAGVAQLHDGRYVGWESWWDATGSGFRNDAYGGTAAVVYALRAETLLATFAENHIELLEFATLDYDVEVVLFDHWLQHRDLERLAIVAKTAGYEPLCAPWRIRWMERLNV